MPSISRNSPRHLLAPELVRVRTNTTQQRQRLERAIRGGEPGAMTSELNNALTFMRSPEGRVAQLGTIAPLIIDMGRALEAHARLAPSLSAPTLALSRSARDLNAQLQRAIDLKDPRLTNHTLGTATAFLSNPQTTNENAFGIIPTAARLAGTLVIGE